MYEDEFLFGATLLAMPSRLLRVMSGDLSGFPGKHLRKALMLAQELRARDPRPRTLGGLKPGDGLNLSTEWRRMAIEFALTEPGEDTFKTPTEALTATFGDDVSRNVMKRIGADYA